MEPQIIKNEPSSQVVIKKRWQLKIILILIFIIVSLIIYYFLSYNQQKFNTINKESSPDITNNLTNGKSDFSIVSIPETKGIQGMSGFKFTISPDGRWIVYFEEKNTAESNYPNIFNLVAFDTTNHKKTIIDAGEFGLKDLSITMETDCWSTNSRYCVFPPGRPRNDPKILERLKVVDFAPDSPWLNGNQLAISEYANETPQEDFTSGNVNNAPDIIIDFTNPATPIFKKQYFKCDDFYDFKTQRMDCKNKDVLIKTPRITFDQISPGGFTCSDCIDANKLLNDDNHDNVDSYDIVSPNERFVAKQIERDSSLNSFRLGPPTPDLYIEDKKTGKQILIDKNVHLDMHFTSDSNKLYYYGCKTFGLCSPGVLYYVDLSNLNRP